MNHKETTLVVENGGTLSFPIRFTNNLPMMFPEETKRCLFAYDFGDNEVFLGVTDNRNNNLSGPEKELLQWHFKFVHIGMRWLQKLMKPRHPRNKTTHEDITNLIRHVIDTKFPSTRTCGSPHCTACHLGKGTRRPTHAK